MTGQRLTEVTILLGLVLSWVMRVVPLFPGFPGRSDRGFLGWSSCVLLLGERPYLFDTLGYNERYELLAALAGHGVAPADVAGVFLSHFHFDHAVNYRLFPNAKLYLHERELQYAREEHTRDLAVPIEMLADVEATDRLRLLSGTAGKVDGVNWFLAPGHTAGLYALRFEQTGSTLVLASDAVKNLGELRTGAAAMAWDRAVSRQTIAAILEIADVIVPGHDRQVRVVREATGIRLEPEGAAEVRISLADEVESEQREWTVRLG